MRAFRSRKPGAEQSSRRRSPSKNPRASPFCKRSPHTATAEDVRRFQLHLTEDGASIQTRHRTMIMA